MLSDKDVYQILNHFCAEMYLNGEQRQELLEIVERNILDLKEMTEAEVWRWINKVGSKYKRETVSTSSVLALLPFGLIILSLSPKVMENPNMYMDKLAKCITEFLEKVEEEGIISFEKPLEIEPKPLTKEEIDRFKKLFEKSGLS